MCGATAALDYQFLSSPLIFLTGCIMSYNSFICRPTGALPAVQVGGETLKEGDEPGSTNVFEIPASL